MTEKEIITLKEYIDHRFCESEKLNNEKFEALGKARLIQSDEIERRLQLLNGEYSRIREIQGASVTKETYDVRHESILTRIQELEKYKAVTEGKASQSSVNVAYIITFVTMIIAIAGLILGFYGH